MSETVEWIDADGVSLTISGPGVITYGVDEPLSGRWMPKIRVQSDGVPGRPGGVFRRADHDVREFVLSLSVAASNDATLRPLLRDLMRRMNPTRGQGKIRVTSPVGDQREITCLYTAGLEGEEKEEVSGPGFQAYPIAFQAFDPYWYDTSPTSKTFTVTTVPNFFPLPPIHLTSSNLVVDDTVTNNGDEETWPVWTITGPGTDIRLVNLTTSKVLDFGVNALGAGEVITVDTRPNIKSVTLDDGTSLYSWVDWTQSQFWPLEVGINAVRLEMSGITANVSGLQISYWQRYLSP